MNEVCSEPIFDARRRLIIFGFHWWNYGGTRVEECFRTRVEKTGRNSVFNSRYFELQTKQRTKNFPSCGVLLQDYISSSLFENFVIFSKLLIKLFEKIILAFRIVQINYFFFREKIHRALSNEIPFLTAENNWRDASQNIFSIWHDLNKT